MSSHEIEGGPNLGNRRFALFHTHTSPDRHFDINW